MNNNSTAVLPNIPVLALGSDGSHVQTTFREVFAGKIGVIDFWHTKCGRCPAAISKLNSQCVEYGETKEVVFAIAALAQDNDLDLVEEIVQEECSDLHHLYVESQHKEQCKQAFGFASVPFYVVFDEEGNIYCSGYANTVNVLQSISILLQRKHAFDMEVEF